MADDCKRHWDAGRFGRAPNRANVISATYALSDGDRKVYVRAGFAF